MVFPPDAMDGPSIQALESTLPLHHVFFESPLKDLPVRKLQSSPAVFLVKLEIPLILVSLP